MEEQVKTTFEIGSYLKRARKKRKMTHEVVAQKSGYTTQTVSNIENNKGGGNVFTLLTLLSVVGIIVTFKLEDRENKNDSSN